MDNSNSTSTESKPEKGKSPETSAPAPQQEEKLNIVIWVLLATGAGIIDLLQIGLEFLVIGTVLNLLIDILVGLSLGTFFLLKGMLNWKTGFSIFLGFAVDFITDGIAPAWIIDIGLVWIQTDGTRQLNKIPIVGEKVKQAAMVAIQKKAGGAGGASGAAGTARKEVAGAGVAKKSMPGTKSVDGMKSETGNENQGVATKPSEKTLVGPEQRQETPGRVTRPTPPSAQEETRDDRGSSVKFGGNFYKEFSESRKQKAREKAVENTSKQFGIGREEAERHAGKDWSNN